MKENQTQFNNIVRPPVVVIMGHVDHGKSTLLDYIRKTNIVDKEAGGITQHISAYEVMHKDESGLDRKITFLDTPGHEAFSKMRARGASTADIAILVVSAEDSVKAQTVEAWNTIVESKVPYIVAINKIDKPNANIEKTKMDLLEKGIYLEGLGGDVPFVPISAKAGTGIDELLSMVLLVADLNSFTGNPKVNATGVIIEAHRDPKRGISATGVIKDGTIKSGMYVVAGSSITTTRIMENFLGKPAKEMTFSSPIRFVGFDEVPPVGGTFTAYDSKKEAEAAALVNKSENKKSTGVDGNFEGKTIPIIIKTDVSGTIEALEKEIEKINTPEISFRIVNAGVGAIGEADLKAASIDSECIILGFNVKLEANARDLNESLHVNVQIFDIIYKLIDYIKEILEERRPRQEVTEVSGSAKVLKIFNGTKDKQIVGGKIISGKVTVGNTVRIMRRDFEIGRGKIVGLEQSKIKASFVEEGNECGILVETKVDIATGDVLESFTITVK
jgi:translation initiation factor IF-2